jgi:hypothetical protein
MGEVLQIDAHHATLSTFAGPKVRLRISKMAANRKVTEIITMGNARLVVRFFSGFINQGPQA